jgi:uncharacterized membrane protein YedE/YeeE
MTQPKLLIRNLAALGAGVVFGVGLELAQMTNPDKVLNFLDVTGHWDASLLLVLGGAVVLAAIAFRFILKRPAPLYDSAFHLPVAKHIDSQLIVGSVLFGLGWGLAGYCPGPAIASLGFGNKEMAIFIPGLAAGIFAKRMLPEKIPSDDD